MSKTISEKISEKTDEIRYVTFLINDEIFGINVMSVKEVMYLESITEVPDTLHYVKGVIDLRGSVVPLVDARIKFNMPERDYDEETVSLILEFKEQLIGLIIDKVLDVINIPDQNIQKKELISSNSDMDKDYIKGIAKIDEKLIILFDVDKILSGKELSEMETKEA